MVVFAKVKFRSWQFVIEIIIAYLKLITKNNKKNLSANIKLM